MVRSLSAIHRDVYNLEAEFLTLRVSLMHATGAAKDKVKLKMDNIKERFEVVRLEVRFKVYLRTFFYVMVYENRGMTLLVIAVRNSKTP